MPRPGWVTGELRGATGRGIRVAVVDSGWDRSVADPRVPPGIGLVDPRDDLALLRGPDDGDLLGHGTACIHQVLRIAPGATVLPVRVFGNRLECAPRVLLEAIDWAAGEGVDVINLSLGTARPDMLRPLYAACERARRAGAVVVAAGGNHWVTYPSVFEHVLGVEKGSFASPFEFRYRPDEALEVEAWGIRHPVTLLGGRVSVGTGTSVAAPNVTGIVALLRERHPGAGVDEIRPLLARFAVD
ncbi:MAG TPA: S8 family serine peptidase [Longimicrobium sp.]|nr:S8 family serine peptidase [Longimicrobium sp.]